MEPWQEEHWTLHWMAALIAFMGETVLVVNVYAPSDKSEREAFFEMLRHHLLGHNGPMFMEGDFNCTLVPWLDRSFASPPGRHDYLALRWLLSRTQLSDVLEDEMEQAEEERAISAFHAAVHTYFYTYQAVAPPVLGLIGGMLVLFMLIGFETLFCLYLAQQLTTME
ncbi:unnamed protein product [Peronospora destructor]|uniref:Endonuclease/exonuclease/phosphatase domain-containing protein n=1 Tax=Peronospora destructor TaxID=86335 RepID=A0AAV0T505_9STRA|nr:unnamed protein product [Peronospora destructor]